MHHFTPPRTSPLASERLKSKRQKLSLPPDLLHRLKSFPLFSDAPNSFFQALAASLRLVQFRPQEYIVKQGEPSKAMYWILRGSVGVTSTDGEAIYAELSAGSFFGEIGILFNRPRTATVAARTKVLLGVLTKDALSNVLADYPKFERIIRDEGQERLAMQEKRKRLSKVSLPALSQRGSIIAPPLPLDIRKSNQPLTTSNDSLLAIDHDQIPGPSLPPIYIDNINSSSSNIEQTPAIDNIDNSISAREFLCHLSIFTSLPNNILHDLALAVEIHRYRPMEYIFREGDYGRDIFFIVYGEVEVIKDHGLMARLGSMNYFGEFAFLSTLNGHSLEPRSADIRTITDCEVLILQGSTLDNICEKYPSIMENMKRTAFERVKSNDSRGGSLDSTNYNTNNDDDSIANTNTNNTNTNNNRSIYNSNYNDNDGDGDGDENEYEHEYEHEHRHGGLGEGEGESGDESGGSFKSFTWENSRKRTYETSIDMDPISGSNTTGTTPMTTSDLSMPTVSFKNFSFTPNSNQEQRQSNNNLDTNTANNNNNNTNSPQLFTLPPLNPSTGSLHRFSTSSFSKNHFKYTPLEYRLRLNGINNGRRRSSVLNVGPLPDSLILKVFQYCDLPTLMKISRVCSRWKQLVYLSNTLMKTLDLTPWCKQLDDTALIQITNFVGARPEIIDLTNSYHITDIGFSYLINEVGISGCIKELKMKNNWNISAMAIMDLSVAARSLKKLDLSNCRKVKDDIIIRLMGNSNDNKFGCPQLEDLNLGYCKYLTDESLRCIGENGFGNLKSLDLTRCTTITDNGFISWLGISNCSLERLILRDCTFLSDKVIEVISLVCINLKALDLTFCCMLTDVSLKLIANGLLNLQLLNLSFCGSAVSDYSLYELDSLRNLKTLLIKGCIRVTRAGVDMLLTKMESLEELTITQCSRVNFYHGQKVDPFDASNGKYCCLKIKPHGRIVKVYV